MKNRLSRVLSSELSGCHPRLQFVQGVTALLPTDAFMRLRPRLYRLAGVRIGRGTVILGRLRLSGSGAVVKRLIIGNDCVLNDNVAFNLGSTVTLEDNVSVGMDCLFITNSHEMGRSAFRAGRVVSRPIRVGRGAWLGARVTVLPGVTVGAGAVVGSGALVAKNVDENVLVGGVPARFIRELDGRGPAPQGPEGGR